MCTATLTPADGQSKTFPRSEHPGVVSFPIRYEMHNYWGYSLFTSAEIGDPPQTVELGVVSNSIITVPYSGICQKDPEACSYGSYDPTKSNSQQIIGSGQFSNNMFGQVGQKFGNDGDVFHERIKLGGIPLPNVTVGLDLQGILPMLNLGELKDQDGKPLSLSTIMANTNVTSSSVYSIALDREDSSVGPAHGNGTLTFGAIDTKKYTGDLVALKASHPTGEDEILTPDGPPLFVCPCVGNQMTTLPSQVVDTIWAEIGDVDPNPNYEDMGVPRVPCERANPDAYLTFQFHGPSGPAIRVPLSDFITPLNPANYTPGLPEKGPGYDVRRQGRQCSLWITKNVNRKKPVNWIVALGQPVIRNAYMVYDLENQVLGIAQASYSVESEIVPFPSRGAQIPLSTPGPILEAPVPYNTTNATFSDFPVAKLETLRAAPGLQAPTLSRDFGTKRNLAIGLGVGLSIGLLATVVGVIFLWVVKLRRPVPFFGRWRAKPTARDRLELEAKEQERGCSDVASSSPSKPTTPVFPTELDARPLMKPIRSPEPRPASSTSAKT
ncbi:Acid protease [Apiospora hydei]|uniref:Acid protease n=1 Tax=Apiospora hydei TaxID=1337664 RepID=A0ABR1WB96_9PEZI